MSNATELYGADQYRPEDDDVNEIRVPRPVPGEYIVILDDPETDADDDDQHTHGLVTPPDTSVKGEFIVKADEIYDDNDDEIVNLLLPNPEPRLVQNPYIVKPKDGSDGPEKTPAHEKQFSQAELETDPAENIVSSTSIKAGMVALEDVLSFDDHALSVVTHDDNREIVHAAIKDVSVHHAPDIAPPPVPDVPMPIAAEMM